MKKKFKAKLTALHVIDPDSIPRARRPGRHSPIKDAPWWDEMKAVLIEVKEAGGIAPYGVALEIDEARDIDPWLKGKHRLTSVVRLIKQELEDLGISPKQVAVSKNTSAKKIYVTDPSHRPGR